MEWNLKGRQRGVSTKVQNIQSIQLHRLVEPLLLPFPTPAAPNFLAVILAHDPIRKVLTPRVLLLATPEERLLGGLGRLVESLEGHHHNHPNTCTDRHPRMTGGELQARGSHP